MFKISHRINIIMKRVILGRDAKIDRNAYIWNSLAGIATAFSSVIMLIIITRVLGVQFAGIYSMAVAVSTVMMIIGSFNIYGYQISDVNGKYQFSTYLTVRIFTAILMMILSIAYILIKGYTADKAIIIFSFCVYKMIDTIVDVFCGLYQQKKRMDISSKLSFCKVFLPDITMAILICTVNNLVFSIVIAFMVEAVVILVFNKYALHLGKEKLVLQKDLKKCYSLIKEVFPLFLGAFMNAYIMNASKYAIDAYLSENLQTYFNVILLPATTIHLFSGFIYRPLLTKIAIFWENKNSNNYKNICFKMFGAIIFISITFIFLGSFLGLPLLELLYGLELEPYKQSFMVLLIAGSFNAFNVLFCFLITIMRSQGKLILTYGITFLLALILPGYFTRTWGIQGAAMAYLLLMLIELICFVVLYSISYQNIWKEI